MGTNYYLVPWEPCSTCSREFEPVHIGKSSGGWCFSLHVIPEDGIESLDDWRREWSKPGVYVRDEYGTRITVQEMEDIITNRDWPNRDDRRKEWWAPVYSSEGQFYLRNHAIPGPRGLLRHQIGEHCVGHGEGTWDYITGEFG